MTDNENRFRLDVIYEPAGKAKEYNPLALNIWDGCTHACRYPCYVPGVLHKKPEKFHAEVRPRDDIMKRATKDIRKLSGMPEWREKEILMCFTSDPYPKVEQKYHFTRSLMGLMMQEGLHFTVLTKSGMAAVPDFAMLQGYPHYRYGVTLSHIHQSIADGWEPRAASVFERIETLRLAKLMGIKTWVSMEPIINPVSALMLIDIIHPYVDTFKVGKWNYNKLAKEINWKQFGWDVTKLLTGHKKDFIIKDDLLAEMDLGRVDQNEKEESDG
jgi:DNA repair photolyase